jgi:nucleoside-diphosphate-sugar epimerase
MKILVTGANSSLGRTISQLARMLNIVVDGTVRHKIKNEYYEYLDDVLFLDLENHNSFQNIKKNYDAIIHVAAKSYGTPEELMRSTGLGTYYLIQKAEELGVSVLVHVSAISIYGEIYETKVDYLTPIRHSSAYGVAKWAAESYLQSHIGSTKCVSVRSPAILSKAFSPHFLGRLVNEMRNQTCLISMSNPEFLFNNIIGERDLSRFLLHLAFNPTDEYKAFPVASSNPISLDKIVNRMAVALKYHGEFKWKEGTSAFSIGLEEAKKFGFQPRDTESTLNFWLSELTTL